MKKLLEKISFQTKIFLGFSIMLLLTLSISIVALWQLSDIHDVNQEVGSKWMPSIDYLRRINDSFDRYLIYELSHINDSIQSNKKTWQIKIDSLRDEIDLNKEEFQKKINSIQQVSAREKSEKAFRKLSKALIDFFTNVAEPTLELSDDNKRSEAMVYRRTEDNVVRLGNYRESMSNLIATNVKGGQNSANSGENIFQDAQRVLYVMLGIAFGLATLTAFVVVREVANKVGGEPSKIAEITEKVSRGDLDITFETNHKNETGIYASVKRMVVTLTNLVQIAKVISEGDTSKKIESKGENDILAASINHMIETFEAQDRVKDNLNKLGQELSGNLPVIEICDKSICFVARFVEASQGVIYMYNPKNSQLNLFGSYAFIERNALSNKYELGQGIIGQVALEKKEILIKDISREDITINSGLINQKPNFVLAMPLLYEEELYGVMELSSFTLFNSTQRKFLEEACRMVAIYLRTSQQTDEVKRLLAIAEEAKAEAEAKSNQIMEANTQLAQQQEELRAQAEDLEDAYSKMEDLNEGLEEKIKERTAEIDQKREEIEAQAESLKEANKQLEVEQQKAEELLTNILPKEVANELKLYGKTSTKHYKLASVLFTDFEGFTSIASKMPAHQLVTELNTVFEDFDQIIGKYNIEKIKTIGDSYMCAGGLPKANVTNPIDTVLAGLEIQRLMDKKWVEKRDQGEEYWRLRIGINSGEVIAGVIGTKKFAYDIWGDTVNSASRMESKGEIGKVNISQYTYDYIKDFFECKYRGKVQAKGKGEMDMYFVKAIKEELSIEGVGIEPNEAFYAKMKEYQEEMNKILLTSLQV